MQKEESRARGDRLKAVEQVEAGRRADPTLPLMARLDGRSFSVFTRGLKRPFDERLSLLMVDTCRHLVGEMHAALGYTQSDEITLFWPVPAIAKDTGKPGEFLFGGKFQKLTSTLAAVATAFFVTELPKRIPEKAGTLPSFDCRVWSVTLEEAFESCVWRQDDAIKNSISMAAQACFPHAQLTGKGSEQKKALLREIGKPWESEPVFFQMGTFVRRESRLVELTAEQLEKIPEKHRPTEAVQRSEVAALEVGYLPKSAIGRQLFGL
jgi:tRNA(His) guanylyltransferase